MSNYLRFIVFFSSLVFLGYTANWWESGISKSLTPENFDDFVGKDKVVVVKFYADYCRFSKDMQPAWDTLAEHYMGENSNRKDVLIAQIEGNQHRTISMRYGIQAFPDFLIFMKGEVLPADKFYGQRTFENFHAWIERFAGPETAPEEVKPKEEEVAKNISSSANADEPETVSEEVKPKEDEVAKKISSFANANKHIQQISI